MAFQSRMTRLPNLGVLPDQVTAELNATPTENVATLKGTVSSERDRKVMRQLILLEPGVDRVDNQIKVVP